MGKSIIIIGAGMGGLSAGIYGQASGYDTQILEQHYLPGGQCTSWKRGGYTFDICIHHFFGASPETRIYQLWKEVGVMPREMVRTEDCVSVFSPEGKLFRDYYDLEKLEQHLLALSPGDARPVKEYLAAIRLFAKSDLMGEMILGSFWSFIGTLFSHPSGLKYLSLTMEKFAAKFSDPFLRSAFPLLVYSAPATPMFFHLVRHALGLRQALQWPVGGAQGLAKSMEKRYTGLGGKIRYRARVVKILVENNRAVGVKLADGSEERADFVISNADGRKTINELLEGKYVDEKTRLYCKEPAEETKWGVHVFLGVKRDLSQEPSSLVLLLDKPETIANHEHKSLEMQIYGFDRSMAPQGGGVIKVELVSGYSYWKNLYAEKASYQAEKAKIARRVVELLEKPFPGIGQQVEQIDVPTLMTFERFIDETHGWLNFPNKKFSINGSLGGRAGQASLPGLASFYFAGAWASALGALFGNVKSGKNAIAAICKADGRRLVAPGD